MKRKCLACPKEITTTNFNRTKLYCSGKCQREMNNYKKGKKKTEEMFKDLRGKRRNKENKRKRKKKTTWKKYRYYIDKPVSP